MDGTKKYDVQTQLYLLSQIFSTPDLYVRCKSILKPDYFDKDFQASIQYVHDYSSKYSAAPTLTDIKFHADYEYIDVPVNYLNHQAVIDHVSEFCRHKALALAVQQSMELVNKKTYGGIEELIREAMLVSVQNEMGLDIYENPGDIIRSLANMQGSFKSGWETLDFKLQGGFGRQELEIFAAASGGGKSVVLQNLAVNFSKAGLNGAYISLELASELVAVRIYGMMTNVKQSQVKNEADETAAKLKIEQVTNGALRIHRLPESVSTANDIESYIRELQIKTGVKLDYVCVDYLDLLTSDRCGPNDKSNAFVKDKFVSEELRAIAMKMDLTVFTACQFNRGGTSEEGKNVRSQSQIAGGISKIYTADNVIFIDARKESGEMIFDFQKTRNSGAVGSKLRMSYNPDSLRVQDHALTIQELGQFGFTHSGINIGNGNLMSAPTLMAPPSTMQILQKQLSSPAPSAAPPVSEELNTPTVSDNSITKMRNFLNNRT